MTVAVESPTRLQAKHRWLAITLATVVMQLSYWPTIASVAASTTDRVDGSGALALGLSIVPLVFITLAFASRHEGAAGAVGRALGVFLLVAAPLGLFDVLVGISVGYAAGGAIALRRDDEVPSARLRWATVVSLTVWLVVLLVAVPPFAVMSGAVLPLAVIGIADQVTEDRLAG